ncbi:tripartite tricarboxylate transporter TctB family protein [Oceanibaculum pacificum]|uniref:DUF1468 domain-containing protein n=1 Tax=Oceanibaculum pacificum TaxID=580166 RepID=A0A154W3W2_9PROT|nr:tripartite tricarboxylate transporter TctB family protein [Oceanibaculum pacificum]KZD08149.1 hypothetical protein AUP43_09065 [Oceanibaculum pacificum]
MNRLNRDTITAIVLLLVCGACFWQTFYIREIPFSTMGSEVWPRFALAMMFVLVSIYLVQSIASPPPRVEGERRSVRAWVSSYSSALWCFGMFFLFVLVMPYLGMLLSGILFVFVTQTVIGRRDPRSLAIHLVVALVAVGGMWAIFRYGLGVALPVGSLFR